MSKSRRSHEDQYNLCRKISFKPYKKIMKNLQDELEIITRANKEGMDAMDVIDLIVMITTSISINMYENAKLALSLNDAQLKMVINLHMENMEVFRDMYSSRKQETLN